MNDMAVSKRRRRQRTSLIDHNKSRIMSLKSWTALFMTCLAVTDASNNNNNGGKSSSFLVMSEMMVPMTMNGQQDESEHARHGLNGENSNVQDTTNSQGDGLAETTNDRGVAVNDTSEGRDAFPVKRDIESASSAGGGGSSDTDGEEDDDVTAERPSLPAKKTHSSTSSSASSSVSQPLRTLKRLQAMLDDSDYATSALSPASLTTGNAHPLDHTDAMPYPDSGSDTTTTKPQTTTAAASAAAQTTNNTPEKLWTRQDRAKYRRTRRSEKQRRDYNEQYRAQQLREMERERIVRQERERKELEDLRRKQLEVLELQRREAQQREAEMQRQLLRLEETETFTDDETDTDGMGFELPNLPVYLSDGETEDFSEEGDENQGVLHDGERARSDRAGGLTYGHSSSVTRRSSVVGHGTGMAQPQRQFGMPQQSGPSPYMYAPPRNSGFDYRQAQAQQRQSPPPQQRQMPPPYDYRQPISPQQQQQQHRAYSTNLPPQGGTPQYQFNNPNQQQMEEQQRQYEQQYAAWAQAAANGYYYPPPIPPPTATFQQQHAPQSQHPAQNQQYTSSFRPPYPTDGQPPNQGYAPPPPYNVHFPSFLPQQRAAPPPESQALQAMPGYQRFGSQGFFSRDNQVTQEWLENRHLSPQSPAMDPARTDHDHQSVQTVPESSNDVVISTLPSPPIDVELPLSTDATMMEDTPGLTRRTEIASPLISSVPTRMIVPINAEGPYCELKDESAVVIAGAESKISFDSIQKLTFSTIGIALLSYCAVSPRSLPFPEYNRLFLQNLFTVGLGVIPPLITLLCVYDGKYNNINTLIGTFHVSFTLGYALALILEIIVTTLLRLGVFLLWEPAIFGLTPEVPCVILPWVLREKQYRPKRITLFACDFGASCIASPIIEEYLKLKIVQWTAFLPRYVSFRPLA
eukprot:CCRYP_012372-RA/>CCRYP_012372-RA protein AED:0.08 eAED:0.08 QI:290/1/1/1/0.8/0.5/6/3004/916